MEIEQIEALIRDVPDFPEPGIVFKDITPVLPHPNAMSTIIDLIVVHFGRGTVDKVVGIEARGFILARAGRVPLQRGLRADPQEGEAAWETVVGGVRARVRDGDARDPRDAIEHGRAGADRRRCARDRRDGEGSRVARRAIGGEDLRDRHA